MKTFLIKLKNVWKSFSKRTKRIIILIFVFLILALLFLRPNQEPQQEASPRSVAVTVLDLSQDLSRPGIETVGTVKPISQIDVMSLGKGTVTQIYVKTGDAVYQGQPLVTLYDATALTNAQTMQIQYVNAQQNYDTVKRMTDESIAQAQLQLQLAQDSYESAQLNFESGQILSQNQTETTVQNAIISYQAYVAFINQTIHDVNYIIKAEGEAQIAGIAPTLAALDFQSLVNAKNTYFEVERAFTDLPKTTSEETILSSIQSIVEVFKMTNILVSETIEVLNNTTSSSSFSETALNAQRQTFSALKNTVVTQQTQAQQLALTVKNLDIQSTQTIDTLTLALQQAENRLQSSQTAYENAKLSAQQQIIGADNALQAMRFQYTQAQKSMSDLTIKAPIAGQITQQLVEVGQQVNMGQQVAQVSQTNAYEIEAFVLAHEANMLQIGQEVIINNSITGTIHLIDPIADPLSKKVKIRILFDFKQHPLIAESRVDLSFPFQEESTSVDTFWIPLKAVTLSGTESFVYIVGENMKAQKVSVRVDRIQKEYIQVTEGLNTNMQVIVEGNKQLSEGTPLSIN